MTGIAAFPDAAYLVLSSRLVPGLDGGYTVATITRARQMADAGGVRPHLLTFDPGTPAAHAEHRAEFARLGAADPSRLRNLFDEGADPAGGAAGWLRAAADPDALDGGGGEHRVLEDPEGRPFLALPVIPGDPDWHLTERPVLVYDETETVIGAIAGFRALYLAWLDEVVAAIEGGRPVLVVCESRQLGELIAHWDNPRVRILHTVHTIHLEPPFTPDAPLNPLWRRWFRIADRFDAVAWPTPTQRDDVVARFGGAGTHLVVPSGVPDPPVPTAAREAGLVVVLGRLAAGKRVDHSIRAFVRAAVPGTRLEIWGAGPEEEHLRALIGELDAGDRVRLAGYTNDPGAVLERASLLLTTSAFEGQQLTIVEALQRGCPVISYDIRYGIREVLGRGGGALVPDGEEGTLAAELRRLLTAPDVLGRLSAEGPGIAAAWGTAPVMAALAEAARTALSGPSRR